MKKKAIIVGATSGIGLEVAKLLSAKGWELGIAGRRVQLLEQISKEMPGVKAYEAIDITQENAPILLDRLIGQMGGIDLYFHSSGIGYQNPSLDVDKEMRTVETNAMGFTRMMTKIFHYFAQNGGGHIACISSIAGTKGLGAAPSYSSTKRFQNHYMECLQQLAHMKGYPITFTDIRPGFVATDLIKDGKYPMKLTAVEVAKEIVDALEKKKPVVVIDWKYRILVNLWKLVPRWIWVRLNISTK